ncbi:hypothetical protein [Erythrobacter donghaensis]|uniref:hypothetical protein n=1 Tax=Erythrobacter donghaensis TaxID=267135 RepID=UPI000A38387F|nr:hypothetical protein [Erythrobacter donghaensis]
MMQRSIRRAMLAAAMLAMPVATLAPAAVHAQDFSELFGGPKAPSGKKLEKLIAKAQKHPLGSQENPVRADMPGGQRAYLSRLRCADGNRPTFDRVGSFGVGVYGRIIDGYEVLCDGSSPEKSLIFMDMYHRGHRETAAVPGFTIEPA